jgi:hypothetical protein
MRIKYKSERENSVIVKLASFCRNLQILLYLPVIILCFPKDVGVVINAGCVVPFKILFHERRKPPLDPDISERNSILKSLLDE